MTIRTIRRPMAGTRLVGRVTGASIAGLQAAALCPLAIPGAHGPTPRPLLARSDLRSRWFCYLPCSTDVADYIPGHHRQDNDRDRDVCGTTPRSDLLVVLAKDIPSGGQADRPGE